MSLNSCPPSFKIVKLGNPDAERDAINAALQAIVRCLGESSIPDQTGHAGEFLTTNGSVLSWAAVSGGSGTVTSAAVTTGTSGVAVTGSPITTSGTIDLDLGTLANVDDAPSDGTTYGRLNGAWAATGQINTIVPGDGIDVDATDPVNPEVSAKISTDANNSASFGSDTGIYVPDNGTFLEGRFGISDFDDFVRGNSAATPIRGGYTLTENVGASSAVNNNFYDAGCAGHQGCLQLVTGTAVFGIARVGGAALSTAASSGFLHLGDGELEVIWWFRIDTLSTSGLRYQFQCGIVDRVLNGTMTDEIQLYYADNINSGVPVIRVRAAGVLQTDANGTTALTASTWYRARLVVNAAITQVDLYLRPYGGSEVHECTYTGTLPAASVALGVGATALKVSGTGSSTAVLDRWQYNYRFTNER